jgi:hypothetical protein
MRLTLRAFAEFKTFGYEGSGAQEIAFSCVPLHISWQDALDGNRDTVIVTGSAESAEDIEAEDVEDLPRDQLVKLLGKFYDRGWCVRFFDDESSYEAFLSEGQWDNSGAKSPALPMHSLPPATRVLHHAERFVRGHGSGEEFTRLRPFRLLLDVQHVDIVEASIWAGMLGMELL